MTRRCPLCGADRYINWMYGYCSSVDNTMVAITTMIMTDENRLIKVKDEDGNSWNIPRNILMEGAFRCNG